MEAYLEKFGLGGIIAYILVREIFIYLAKKREKEKSNDKLCFQKDIDFIKNKIKELHAVLGIISKVEDLYSWHNRFDSSGQFLWYKDFSTPKDIQRILTTIDLLSESIRSIDADLSEIKSKIKFKSEI